jgi:hypothetical protein
MDRKDQEIIENAVDVVAGRWTREIKNDIAYHSGFIREALALLRGWLIILAGILVVGFLGIGWILYHS